MSIDRKRTEIVYGIVCELAEHGQGTFLPGDVCSVLRARNQPMDAWLVRGEFHILEEEALIELEPETGDWRRTGNAMSPGNAARLSDAG